MGHGRRTLPACLLMVVCNSSQRQRHGTVQPVVGRFIAASMANFSLGVQGRPEGLQEWPCRFQVCKLCCLIPALLQGCLLTSACCIVMIPYGVWLLLAGLTIAGSRSAAYFEAQRRIAVTIRNMYEVGQRVPPLESAMSLSAAQAWDSSHREVSLSRKLHP